MDFFTTYSYRQTPNHLYPDSSIFGFFLAVEQSASFVLFSVAPASLDQDRYAGIDNTIKGLNTLAATIHHPSIGQSLELVRKGLHRHTDLCRKIVDAEITTTTDQGMDDP